MNFIAFKKALSPLPGLYLSDIKKVDADFHRTRLTEWQNQKKLP